MFYLAAKLLWFLLEPSALLVLGVMAAAVLLRARRRRAAEASLALALVIGLAAWSPLPRLAARPLEQRFTRADLDARPVTGILILGGGELADIYFRRNKAHGLNDAGERITEAVALARRLPDARVVVVGRSESAEKGEIENNVMAAMLASMGVAAGRLELEGRSRDTWENAIFAREVVKPKPGERWLLVTSAWHMPRAIGVFRRSGFPVEAWPVDYRTTGGWGDLEPFYSPSDGLSLLDTIFKEYVGLVSYRLAGRSDDLFPGP